MNNRYLAWHAVYFTVHPKTLTDFLSGQTRFPHLWIFFTWEKGKLGGAGRSGQNKIKPYFWVQSELHFVNM